MADSFEDRTKVWIACPTCAFKTEKALDWVEENDSFECSICNSPVAVQPKRLGFKSPEQAGSRFGRSFLARSLRLG